MYKLLKEKHIKLTSQRKIVYDLVEKLEPLSTAKNISDSCKDTVDKSTVYRIIDLFVEKGIFEKNLNYENDDYYSIKEEHGHYFICIKCNKKEKIDSCPLEEIDENLESKKGYKVLSHTVKIEGICPSCQTKSK